ncbi:MAG: DNA double-strand break repair nuclease NurA [Thermoplasmata archaeon]
MVDRMKFDESDYDDFVKYLKNEKAKINSSLLMNGDSGARRYYEGVFKDFYVPYDSISEFKYEGKVSATDSSEFMRELYSGNIFTMVRAYTKASENVYVDFKSDIIKIDPESIRNFTILLMENSEHISLEKAIRKDDIKYAFVDGSFMGRISHGNTKDVPPGYENFMSTYYRNLQSMLDAGFSSNTVFIFMAKSSRSVFLRDAMLDAINDQTFAEKEKISGHTDHYIIKSLARSRGYTKSLMKKESIGTLKIIVNTFDIMPDINDVPIHVDVISPEEMDLSHLISMLFWAYGGYRVHNIWLSEIDNIVKFRSREVENLYMKTFETETGVTFYETRGERRARLRL